MAAFPRKAATSYLRRVARDNGVSIHWRNGKGWHLAALAEGRKMRVTIPKPQNIRQLLVGLHELGHLLGVLPLQDDTPDDWNIATRTVLREAAAWAWALEHIPDNLGDGMHNREFDRTIGQGMASHCWSAYTAHDGD